MMGSETFIMVHLRCSESSASSAFAAPICSAKNARSAATFITAASRTSPSSSGTRSFSTVVAPAPSVNSIRASPAFSTVTDFSLS